MGARSGLIVHSLHLLYTPPPNTKTFVPSQCAEAHNLYATKAYVISVRRGRRAWNVFRRYNQFNELDLKVQASLSSLFKFSL